MKKMMFTLAMVMGLGTSVAFADNVPTTACTAVAQVADEFTPIELKDLPQAVQDGLAKKFAGCIVKAAAVSTDKETQTSTFKVTLADVEGNEQTVLISDKGELVTASETAEGGEETAFCDAI